MAFTASPPGAAPGCQAQDPLCGATKQPGQPPGRQQLHGRGFTAGQRQPGPAPALDASSPHAGAGSTSRGAQPQPQRCGCWVRGAGCGGPGLPAAGSPGAVTAPPPPPLNHPLPAARITNAAGSSGLDPASRAGSSLLGWIPLPGLCKAPVAREGEGMERGSSAPNPAPISLGSPGPAARAPALPLGAGLGHEASCPAGHRHLPPHSPKGLRGWDLGQQRAQSHCKARARHRPDPGSKPRSRSTTQLQKHQQKRQRSQRSPFFPPITKDQKWRRWTRRLNEAPRNAGLCSTLSASAHNLQGSFTRFATWDLNSHPCGFLITQYLWK